MGFYSPSTLVADAKRHGVEVRPVSITESDWECTLERAEDETNRQAVRLGLNQVSGLKKEAALSAIKMRNTDDKKLFSIAELVHSAALDKGSTRALARADAFASIGVNRREVLWQIEGLWQGPLLAPLPSTDREVPLPTASPWEQMSLDYGATGLSLRAHPIALMRERLKGAGAVTIESLSRTAPGALVKLAVIVTHRQRPATASGVLFMGVEDETGMSNVIVWPKVYERQRKIIRDGNILIITGRLQRNAEAISVVAFKFSKPKKNGNCNDFRSRDFR
jgi:error-prone DNA polymerase